MTGTDGTVRHLYVELARLDILIHRRMSAMERSLHHGGAAARAAAASNPALAGPEDAAGALGALARPEVGALAEEVSVRAPAAAARPMHLGFEDAFRMLQQPFGERRVGDSDAGEPDDGYDDALAHMERQIAAIVQEADEQGDPSRLVHLAAACDLTRFELDAILICLAPALDLRYERLYGFLHDDLTRRRATVSLILDLLAPPGPGRLAALRRFGDGMTLFRDRLVERVAEPGILQPVLLNSALAPESSLVTWLLGEYRPGPLLREVVTWDAAPRSVAHRFLPTQMDELANATADESLLAMVGKDGAAQRAAMATYAATLGLPLLLLDLAAAQRLGADIEGVIH
ncbi:MAG: hypothetical protein ACRC1H_11295, partial [Caldilineaceae bacterium]